MYKWVDETGSVTYSNAPPADPAKAREVTTLEDISSDLGEREKSSEAARSNPGANADASSPAAVTHTPEAVDSAAPPHVNARRLRAEAVQDPCLRSPDPQCHQRNQDKYDPYLGYAPSTLAPPAVGATTSAGARGAVGGYVGRPAR